MVVTSGNDTAVTCRGDRWDDEVVRGSPAVPLCGEDARFLHRREPVPDVARLEAGQRRETSRAGKRTPGVLRLKIVLPQRQKDQPITGSPSANNP